MEKEKTFEKGSVEVFDRKDLIDMMSKKFLELGILSKELAQGVKRVWKAKEVKLGKNEPSVIFVEQGAGKINHLLKGLAIIAKKERGKDVCVNDFNGVHINVVDVKPKYKRDKDYLNQVSEIGADLFYQTIEGEKYKRNKKEVQGFEISLMKLKK
jgi:hypothetical protein